EGIRRPTGKPGQHLILVQPPHLAGVALHDRITLGDLSVAPDDHLAAASYRDDRGTTKLFQARLLPTRAGVRDWGFAPTCGLPLGYGERARGIQVQRVRRTGRWQQTYWLMPMRIVSMLLLRSRRSIWLSSSRET